MIEDKKLKTLTFEVKEISFQQKLLIHYKKCANSFFVNQQIVPDTKNK